MLYVKWICSWTFLQVGKCKYNIVRNGDIKHLCDDACFRRFRANPTMFLKGTAVSDKSKAPQRALRQATAKTSVPGIKSCAVCLVMNVNAQVRDLERHWFQRVHFQAQVVAKTSFDWTSPNSWVECVRSAIVKAVQQRLMLWGWIIHALSQSYWPPPPPIPYSWVGDCRNSTEFP